jgi:hypothetical protein
MSRDAGGGAAGASLSVAALLASVDSQRLILVVEDVESRRVHCFRDVDVVAGPDVNRGASETMDRTLRVSRPPAVSLTAADNFAREIRLLARRGG